MAFATKDVLRRLLAQDPCPLTVIYWGLERLTPDEARHVLGDLRGHERVLVLGRFAYVEAPSPGQPERRTSGVPSLYGPIGSLRLADIWTMPGYAAKLERRVMEALEGLAMPAAELRARTGLPHRTLEAVCYACEEKGLLRVLPYGGPADGAAETTFAVCRVAQPACCQGEHVGLRD